MGPRLRIGYRDVRTRWPRLGTARGAREPWHAAQPTLPTASQSAAIVMHTLFGPRNWTQSASLAQIGGSPKPFKFHSTLFAHEHAPDSFCTHHGHDGFWHVNAGLLQSKGAHPLHDPPDAAKAGVWRLVMIGADQATAAPAPMRFSILRREIRAAASSKPLVSGTTVSTPRGSLRECAPTTKG